MHDLLPSLPGQLNEVINSLSYFIPELYLSALFILVLVTDLIFGKDSAWLCRILACVGLLVVIFHGLLQLKLIIVGGHIEGRPFFNEMLLLTAKSLTFKLIIDVLSFI